jgi:uncharacterized membrane protein YeaQ/YmgE (transglycosylase-associated protein family)
VDLIGFLLIGLAAGWLAGRITKRGSTGLLGDLIVGVVGAFVGGLLFGLVGLQASNLIGRLLVATAGAVALIAGLRAWNGRRSIV